MPLIFPLCVLIALTCTMAGGNKVATAQTPETPTPALKKSTSNTQNVKNQKTLLGFFQKTPTTVSSTSTLAERLPTTSRKNGVGQSKNFSRANSSHITPAPSSDALNEDDDIQSGGVQKESSRSTEGLPSPVPSANGEIMRQTLAEAEELTAFGTPSRKVANPNSVYNEHADM